MNPGSDFFARKYAIAGPIIVILVRAIQTSARPE
jgi:hypothetical protein